MSINAYCSRATNLKKTNCKRYVAFKNAKALKNAGINPRRIQIMHEVKEKDTVDRLFFFFVGNVKTKSAEK